ncbi:hypothetical protein, partial [Prevotellamassilia timonensis]|uniref:hypothetical protein n=1 Tax=Prevotellamassilia timonensis TaxID=1852370 RepID=UPI003FEFFCA1
ATAPTRDTQGAASLALGYGFHWAFSPPLLNPKLKLLKSIQGDGVQVLYITCATSPCFIACWYTLAVLRHQRVCVCFP